ncbi:MAG: hypothetical protein KGL39_28540 [Patescibacteria group bacterium]|nr:hypothetical protein [Patescibacteria group bacterium]
MSRELLPLSGYTQEPSAVVVGSVVGLVEFLEIDLPSGNVYLTNAPMPYTWGGNTYNPTTTTGAPYGSMINYNESTDGTPRPMSLQLSGADPTLVSNLVSNNIQWCKVVWSLGLIDSANNLINGTPMMSQPWYIGDCTITKGNGKASVLINCESLLADMKDRNSGMLQTVQDQQQRFAGDTFFTFAESLMYQWIYWNQQGPMQIGAFGMGGGGVRHRML